MKRSVTREMAVHFVYAYAFGGQTLSELLPECGQPEYYRRAAEEDALFRSPPDETETAYLHRIVEGVASHRPELDSYIEKYAVGWRFERISRIAVAIMRVAMFELTYMPEIPERVAINEAIEIAKKYEATEAVSFINGVLGSFSRRETPGTVGDLPDDVTLENEGSPKEEKEDVQPEAGDEGACPEEAESDAPSAESDCLAAPEENGKKAVQPEEGL